MSHPTVSYISPTVSYISPHSDLHLTPQWVTTHPTVSYSTSYSELHSTSPVRPTVYLAHNEGCISPKLSYSSLTLNQISATAYCKSPTLSKISLTMSYIALALGYISLTLSYLYSHWTITHQLWITPYPRANSSTLIWISTTLSYSLSNWDSGLHNISHTSVSANSR